MKTITARGTMLGTVSLYFLGFVLAVALELSEAALVAVPIAFGVVGMLVGRVIGGLLDPPPPGLEVVKPPVAREDREATMLPGLRALYDAMSDDAPAASPRSGQWVDTVLPEIAPS